MMNKILTLALSLIIIIWLVISFSESDEIMNVPMAEDKQRQLTKVDDLERELKTEPAFESNPVDESYLDINDIETGIDIDGYLESMEFREDETVEPAIESDMPLEIESDEYLYIDDAIESDFPVETEFSDDEAYSSDAIESDMAILTEWDVEEQYSEPAIKADLPLEIDESIE